VDRCCEAVEKCGWSLVRRTGWKCVGRSALSFVERCGWEYVNRDMGGCGEVWVGVCGEGACRFAERYGWECMGRVVVRLWRGVGGHFFTGQTNNRQTDKTKCLTPTVHGQL